MLTPIQRQAIAHCLTGIDLHAHRSYPWPGPVLLAALRDTPVAGHPDPSARHLAVVPVPVPSTTWRHPDGPVEALGQVAADLHHPVIQASVALADETKVRLLAWAFMHATRIDNTDPTSTQVRLVEAVDIDDTVYVLTHLPDQPHGEIAIHDAASDTGARRTVTLLRALARTIRTR